MLDSILNTFLMIIYIKIQTIFITGLSQINLNINALIRANNNQPFFTYVSTGLLVIRMTSSYYKRELTVIARMIELKEIKQKF